MRYLYVIIWAVLPLAAWGQAPASALPTDSGRYEVAVDARRVSSRVDSTGACVETLRWGEPAALVRVYYPSGRLQAYMPYADLAAGVRHGLLTTWYDDGQCSSSQPYTSGQREGTLLIYYANGQLKRQTTYVAGHELPGNCFGPAGEAVAYYPYEQLPLYPGGYGQLTKELTQALRWPHRIAPAFLVGPGLVDVRFQVAEDGSIQHPEVAVSCLVPELDQAVLAAVAKLARRFHPGRLDGVVAVCDYHLPVQVRGLVPPASPNQKL